MSIFNQQFSLLRGYFLMFNLYFKTWVGLIYTERELKTRLVANNILQRIPIIGLLFLKYLLYDKECLKLSLFSLKAFTLVLNRITLLLPESPL